MPDVESSLQSLEEAVEEMESYLLSKETFRARTGRESLSLGMIALARKQLAARQEELAPTESDRFENVQANLDTIHEKWRVAWERKATGELRSRLNLWREYLADLEGRPSMGNSYPQEVRNRAMAVELLDAAGNQPEVKGLEASLDAIDGRLREILRPGEFVWDEELRPVYPREQYWFLYGKPSSRSD
ncbi:MAG: hypothetical protein ACE5MM_09915 [Nitrospiraceae bacterium]